MASQTGPSPIFPGAVVGRIWEYYQREAGVLLGAAAILYAVEFVIALILPTRLGILATIAFWILSILYQGFVVEVVAAAQDGRRAGQGELLSKVTPVLWELLAISIVFGFGVAIGLILIIVPGLILLTIWSVAVPVEVLERRGVFGSFGRSRELVRGNGWNVLGVILIVFLVTIAISVVVELLASPLGHAGRDLVQWAVNVALAPVVGLGATVLYYELRRAQAEPAPAG